MKTRGIYCVAFGTPSRRCASKMIKTVKKQMPGVPVALCSDRKLGKEDIFVRQPDSDVGGRRAKLMAYDLAPKQWQSVLYLDADIELVAPVYRLFEWVESGWDFLICHDVLNQQTLHSVGRRYLKAEADATLDVVKSWDMLQFNGGVWALNRNERTQAFMAAWLGEWERWGQRDQGAFIRALHSHPMRILVLGNEWNTFPKHDPGSEKRTAGILHFPGRARRWKGLIPARLDSSQAWDAVRRFGVGQ